MNNHLKYFTEKQIVLNDYETRKLFCRTFWQKVQGLSKIICYNKPFTAFAPTSNI
jgi:hypothetical protein